MLTKKEEMEFNKLAKNSYTPEKWSKYVKLYIKKIKDNTEFQDKVLTERAI